MNGSDFPREAISVEFRTPMLAQELICGKTPMLSKWSFKRTRQCRMIVPFKCISVTKENMTLYDMCRCLIIANRDHPKSNMC